MQRREKIASYTILSNEFSTLLLLSLILFLTPPGLVQAEPDDYREHRLRLHLHPCPDGSGQVGGEHKGSM